MTSLFNINKQKIREKEKKRREREGGKKGKIKNESL